MINVIAAVVAERSKRIVLVDKSIQDRWRKNIEIHDRLATEIAFYENNQSVQKDLSRLLEDLD